MANVFTTTDRNFKLNYTIIKTSLYFSGCILKQVT